VFVDDQQRNVDGALRAGMQAACTSTFFARVQTALTFTMLVFLLLTAATGLAGSPTAPAAQGLSAMGADITVFGIVALVMYSLIGTEFVTPLTRRPRATPPATCRGRCSVGLTVVALANAAFCLAAVAAVGRAPGWARARCRTWTWCRRSSAPARGCCSPRLPSPPPPAC
jgi:hypothetical protein